mmetsp:Transcript_36419/g.107507  ORF Transcript_36419/g.107507 Transcript_36419/m.107507 type:complete len:242 (+) Transcript_36419:840-1565(+)
MRLNVFNQLVAVYALDVLNRPQDGSPKRVVLESCRMQVVKHKLGHLLVDLFHFAQNHVALSVDGALVKVGVQQDVGQDVDSPSNVLSQDLSVVARLLAASVSIELSSHILNLHLKLLDCSPLGALEQDVLQEVCYAVVLVRLETAARVDPRAHRGRLREGGALRGDTNAVCQRGDLGVRQCRQERCVVDGCGRGGREARERRGGRRLRGGTEAGEGAPSQGARLTPLLKQPRECPHGWSSR